MSTTGRLAAAAALLLSCSVSDARAQSSPSMAPPSIILVPPHPSRWDVSALVGRFDVNRPEFAYPWNEWYGSASGALAAGFYVTQNLKIEASVSRSAEADVYKSETIPIPGEIYPSYLSRTHHFTTRTVSAGGIYQFFENRWFHPFVGAGVDLTRERRHADASTSGPPPRSGITFVFPVLPEETVFRSTTRPFATGGFKAYLAPKVFFRSDVRVGWSKAGAASSDWRTGIGFDF